MGFEIKMKNNGNIFGQPNELNSYNGNINTK